MSENIEEPDNGDVHVIQAELEVEIADTRDLAITDEIAPVREVEGGESVIYSHQEANKEDVEGDSMSEGEDLETVPSEDGGDDVGGLVEEAMDTTEGHVDAEMEEGQGCEAAAEEDEQEIRFSLDEIGSDKHEEMEEEEEEAMTTVPAQEEQETSETDNQGETAISEEADLAPKAATAAPTSENKTVNEESTSERISELKSVTESNAATEVSSDASQDSSTPKVSRELQSLLALSKEANLDTNLTTRRKTLEKVKERHTPIISSTPSIPTKDAGITPKKVQKITNFPVTAESELEELDDMSLLQREGMVFEGRDERSPRKILKAKSVENLAPTQVVRGKPLKPNKDMFCWRCHHDGVQIACETCPRTYHQKCLKQTITDTEHWPCPECVSILKAENTKTRSKAMKGMTLEHLCSLLKFAVKRMIKCDGSGPFMHPVDEAQFPEYKKYIVQPMDLTMLEKNIKENAYGSTQAFEADAKWILHNSIIFNSYQSKLTSAAKAIAKICKQEMAEIENCPSCYLNANTKKHTWFVEVCPKPHLLVWAKLKGFPYWPAKVMSYNNNTGMVDVRFFGAHDKAWVNVKDCYMYSLKDPNSGKQKRNDIIECVKELERYVDNLKRVHGRVNYAQFKTPLDPANEHKHLKSFLPNYSESKSSKESSKTIVNEPVTDRKSSLSSDRSENNTTPKLGQPNNDAEASDGTNTDSSSSSSNKLESVEKNKDKDKESQLERRDDTPKILPARTRIEFRPTMVRPKWVVKPLKTIVIRKRPAQPDVGSEATPPKKILRKSYDRNVTPTIDGKDQNDGKKSDNGDATKDDSSEKTDVSTQGKLKITYEIMKKLENAENDGVVGAEAEKKTADENDAAKDNEKVSEESEGNEKNAPQENGPQEISSVVPEEQDPKKSTTQGTKDGEETQDETEKSDSVVTTQVEVDDKKSSDKANADEIPLKSKPVENETDNAEKPQEKDDKKRKAPEQDDKAISPAPFPTNKMVKLVPIENILQKKVDASTNVVRREVVPDAPEKSRSAPQKPASSGGHQLILLKEIRMISKDGKERPNQQTPINKTQTLSTKQIGTAKSNVGNKQNTPGAKQQPPIPPPIEIKDEVESEGENDDQYMEAKRQYLSALNISEKQSVPAKPKLNEIRTRSKTEERRTKSIDTAAISKVTNNLTAAHSDSALPTADGSDALRKSTTANATSQNNEHTASGKEIYIKSLSKMQAAKHKARKSFPTPNYKNNNNSSSSHGSRKSGSSVTTTKPILPKPSADETPTVTATTTTTTTPISSGATIKIMNRPLMSGDDVTTTGPTIRLINTSSLQPITSTTNLVLLPKLHYTSKPPPLSMVGDVGNTAGTITVPRLTTRSGLGKKTVLVQSQNFIPQNEDDRNMEDDNDLSLCNNLNNIISNTSATTQIGDSDSAANSNSLLIVSNETSNNNSNSTSSAVVPTVSLPVLPTPPVAMSPPATSTAPNNNESNADNNTSRSNNNNGEISSQQIDKELGPLKDILPENVSKALGDILSQPPPKLKPKPFGVINTVCDAGPPPTAGPASAKFSTGAQKMSDYLRALIWEIITDLGKSNNPEAMIASLRQELEESNHKHAIELAEIRRNVSVVSLDMQKSMMEEIERRVHETKSRCESEAQKRIDEAKSKQWCANCLKEAQFYCCWNTSYCDYPCQQKHWPKHMSKCTQSNNQNQGSTTAGATLSNSIGSTATASNGTATISGTPTTSSSSINNTSNTSVQSQQPHSPVIAAGSGGSLQQQQQLVLTPTAPPKFGTLFAKPQKVYLKRASAPFKQSPTGTAGHITLVESTPGQFELVGGGPITMNGKILASSSVIEKIKSGNIVTVTAPSGVSSVNAGELMSTSSASYHHLHHGGHLLPQQQQQVQHQQKVTIAAYKGPNVARLTSGSGNTAASSADSEH